VSACTNGLNACAAPPPHCLTAKFILLLIRLNSSCMKPPGSGTEGSRRRESMSEVLSRGSSSEEGYYFQRSMLVSQIWSGFPRKFCTRGSRSKWTGINVSDISLRICMFSIGSTGCFRSLETQREKDGSNTIYGWDSYSCTGSTSCFFILPLIPVHLLREPL
jgi:hypothetical protein